LVLDQVADVAVAVGGRRWLMRTMVGLLVTRTILPRHDPGVGLPMRDDLP
jgi:hypothetical protein